MLRLTLLCLIGLAMTGPAIAQEGGGEETYRIGSDDVVQIQVWQRPGLNGSYVVDQNGELNLPLIGVVNAEGLTEPELREELERRFAILDPGITQVLITITGYRSRSYTVVGEVRNPGRYMFREHPSLWDVILMAGGETTVADMGGVQIRREPEGGGPAVTITADLSGGLEGTTESDLPELQPGDQIVVPARQMNYVAGGDQVQVLGSVRAPGIYPLRVASTVVEALSASGGTTERADMSEVKLTRRTSEGAVVYDLNMKEYLGQGYPGADLALKSGDTILVPDQGGLGPVFGTVLQISGFVSAIATLIIAVNSIN